MRVFRGGPVAAAVQWAAGLQSVYLSVDQKTRRAASAASCTPSHGRQCRCRELRASLRCRHAPEGSMSSPCFISTEGAKARMSLRPTRATLGMLPARP